MSREKGSQSARNIVLSMLTATLDEGAFSHIVMKETLSRTGADHREKVFMERLFHGTLEQVIFLDWIISSFSTVKLQKIKPVVRNILRMSLYQILFMESVPDHAAVNEAVKLTKARGLKGLVPFVNGLLRAFLREGIRPGMPENVKHSAPSWLYDRLVLELGKEKADAFLDAACRPKNEIFARLSLSRAPAEEIVRMLEAEGCSVMQVPDIPEAVQLKQVRNLTELKAWKQGLVFVQDLSSIRVGRTAAELADSPGFSGRSSLEEKAGPVKKTVRRILDVCAAPGGKSLHLAELFPDAEVTARDLSEAKVSLLRENIRRSQLKNLHAEVHDALVFDETLSEKADIVLADLPCSGIGVIGRKPDIKLRLKEEDLETLAKLQRDILGTVSGYVREGGLLLYSTCTINPSENQENADWLEKNFSFQKLSERQFLPGQDEGDGFYIAAFRKKENAPETAVIPGQT